MNEEKTNIVPYNQPKDYSNSNRSKAAAAQQNPPPLVRNSAPQTTISTEKSDGFFKATLKEAVDHAIKTVVDPMVRNFVYSTGMSILNTLLWHGKYGTPGSTPIVNTTPYHMISTPSAGTGVQKQPQMTQQDLVWQRYEKLHVDTLEQAQSIMSRLYRIFRSNGRVTLAQYYEAFGEKYDFASETWGWNNLPKDKMYSQQFSDGYHIFMPKLEPLT